MSILFRHRGRWWSLLSGAHLRPRAGPLPGRQGPGRQGALASPSASAPRLLGLHAGARPSTRSRSCRWAATSRWPARTRPSRSRPRTRAAPSSSSRPWKRLAIAFAGPAMNLIFPVVIYLALGLAQNGEPVPGPVIGTVAPGSPAAVAGLPPGRPHPGGRRRRARRRGRSATSPTCATSWRRTPGEPLTFTVERGGAAASWHIVPASEDDSNPVEKQHPRRHRRDPGLRHGAGGAGPRRGRAAPAARPRRPRGRARGAQRRRPRGGPGGGRLRAGRPRGAARRRQGARRRCRSTAVPTCVADGAAGHPAGRPDRVGLPRPRWTRARRPRRPA